MTCSWRFFLALEAVGVRPASEACEEDRRGLALSEGVNVHVCRDRCFFGSSRQAITTCCALV